MASLPTRNIPIIQEYVENRLDKKITVENIIMQLNKHSDKQNVHQAMKDQSYQN